MLQSNWSLHYVEGRLATKLITSKVLASHKIVQGLTDNAQWYWRQPFQLIMGRSKVWVDAIPQLIAALPAIITALVDFIIGSIPQIIDAGIQLLVSLVEALRKSLQQ